MHTLQRFSGRVLHTKKSVGRAETPRASTNVISLDIQTAVGRGGRVQIRRWAVAQAEDPPRDGVLLLVVDNNYRHVSMI